MDWFIFIALARMQLLELFDSVDLNMEGLLGSFIVIQWNTMDWLIFIVKEKPYGRFPTVGGFGIHQFIFTMSLRLVIIKLPTVVKRWFCWFEYQRSKWKDYSGRFYSITVIQLGRDSETLSWQPQHLHFRSFRL